MLYFSKSVILMTSVFLCANIRLHTFIRNLARHLQLDAGFYIAHGNLNPKISFLVLPKKKNSH